MKFRVSIIVSVCSLLVSCQTEHRVIGDSLDRTRVGGEKLLEEKFSGNWKPEDAAWYSAPGETNKKKMAEREQGMKRSQFQKVVSESRGKGEERGPSQWDKRANYEKEWGGTKEKKTFAWPWQKADVKHKESNLTKQFQGTEQRSEEGAQVARESSKNDHEGSKTYATSDYNHRRSEVEKKEQWQAAKPEMHKGLKIIEDRSEQKEDTGWSVSDIRKFLNKR